jgi:hypothetical protein
MPVFSVFSNQASTNRHQILVINAFFIAKPSKYNHGFNSSLVSRSELIPSAHFLYFVAHEKAEKTRIPQAQVDTVEVSGQPRAKG